MKSAWAVALACTAQPSITHAQDACGFDGAMIIADDYANTYLGSVGTESDADSIFNEEGAYGSQSGLDSVWNVKGVFGSEHSIYSARNPETPSPPMILKDGRVVGYLTDNVSIGNGISLESLAERCASVIAGGRQGDR